MLLNIVKISCFLGLFLSIDAMYLVSNQTRYVVYRNILIPEYRDQFVFSTFPSHSGDPKNVADGQDKYFSDKVGVVCSCLDQSILQHIFLKKSVCQILKNNSDSGHVCYQIQAFTKWIIKF